MNVVYLIMFGLLYRLLTARHNAQYTRRRGRGVHMGFGRFLRTTGSTRVMDSETGQLVREWSVAIRSR